VRYVAGFLSLISAALLTAAIAPGCSNSSEGQPCSTLGSNQGDDECQSGLTCTAAAQLNGGGYTKDVCCPTDRSQATMTICQLPTNPLGDAGGFPDVGSSADTSADTEVPDSGSADGPTSDGAAADGPADAPGDTRGTPGDARTEGG
jgi:hypothetical protein